jgi:hypothetical protein
MRCSWRCPTTTPSPWPSVSRRSRPRTPPAASTATWRRYATWPNERSEHAKILDAVSSGSDTVADLLREHIGRFFDRIEGAEWYDD